MTGLPIRPRDLQRIVCTIDSGWKLQSVEKIGGRAFALGVLAREQCVRRLVLLTHSQADRERNPQIARDEFRLLKTLKAAGMPVPAALLLCEAQESPFLLTSFVQGASRLETDDVPAFCRKLAAVLCAVHAVDLLEHELAFLPQLTDSIAGGAPLPNATQERIHVALKRALPKVEFNAPTLLHGDYWLGNLLWKGDQLEAIIDWEDAMIGDPLADLGKSRLEILWALGEEAMALYTQYHLALNPGLDASALPFWDLWGASRLQHYASFASDAGRVPQMRAQYETFVADALSRLDAVYE